MDKLRELAADLSRYFQQLTRRERILVVLAAASVVVFVGSITLATVSRSIDRTELAIADRLQALQQVGVYAQGYAANERSRRELEARLSGPPVRLMSHLQELADRHGVAIRSMNERGDQTTGQVKETLVELDIGEVPIEKVTAFVNDVEASPKIVKVRKLRLHKNSGDTKALVVKLTVATYQLGEKG
jgi:general secretion pathway protein M